MTMLIAGILLWTAAHLVPGAVPGVRQDIVAGIGEKAWKGLFELVAGVAVTLVVFAALVWAHPYFTGVPVIVR